MYWKLVEFIVRLVYFKRFRQADKIARAAELATAGKPDDALAALDSIASNLHPAVAGIFGLTRGRILCSEGRLGEAVEALVRAAKLDPSNAKVHLDLAVVTGRLGRLDDARARLELLAKDADDETKKEAREVLTLLKKIVSGKQEKEFVKRAAAMAAKPIGPGGETAGLPANTNLLDEWITRSPDEASDSADELALLLGQSAVVAQNASWKVNLSIEESFVESADEKKLYPFAIVAERLAGGERSLSELCEGGWE